jgi:hypothetical protein
MDQPPIIPLWVELVLSTIASREIRVAQMIAKDIAGMNLMDVFLQELEYYGML